MNTRSEINKLLKEWNLTGNPVCKGYRDWGVYDVEGVDSNGFCEALRKKFPFPDWIINVRRKGCG